MKLQIRLKTAVNSKMKWCEINPLEFNLQRKDKDVAVSYATQILVNAKRDRPKDDKLKVRWNWKGGSQGYYIS